MGASTQTQKAPFVPKLGSKPLTSNKNPLGGNPLGGNPLGASKGPTLPSLPKASSKPIRKGALFDDDNDEGDFMKKKPKPVETQQKQAKVSTGLNK